jgi:hypothetical protein
MTRKRHTEEQIIAVLKDVQAGVSVQALCRNHGISDATFFGDLFPAAHLLDCIDIDHALDQPGGKGAASILSSRLRIGFRMSRSDSCHSAKARR